MVYCSWFMLIAGEFQEPGFRIGIEHRCVAHLLLRNNNRQSEDGNIGLTAQSRVTIILHVPVCTNGS